jgi:hypothetical protein
METLVDCAKNIGNRGLKNIIKTVGFVYMLQLKTKNWIKP